MKLKQILVRHKALPLLMGFIYLYLFAVVSKWKPFGVDVFTYAFHAVDFSMGFCTKILPGDIYNRLVGVYDEKTMNLYLNIVYAVFFFLLSLLLEKFLTAMPRKYQKSTAVLLFLFITGPFTLATFVDEFGLLDFYWILLAIISLFFLQNKYLRWLIPVNIFLMVLVYYASTLCYVAGLLLLILYGAFSSGEKKEKRKSLVLFGLSFGTAFAETVYFLRNEYANLKFPMETFDSIMQSRNVDNTIYYDYALYRVVVDSDISNAPDLNSNSGAVKGVFGEIATQIEMTLKTLPGLSNIHHFKPYWFCYILAAFLLVPLLYVLIVSLKKTDNKMKKATLGLMIASFFCIAAVGVFFSTDVARWLSHAFLVLFGYVFYLLCHDGCEALRRFERFLNKNAFFTAVFCLIYCLTTVHVYS